MRAIFFVIAMTACTTTTEALDVVDQSAATPLQWVGDAHLRISGHWLPPELILAGLPLEVHVDSYPAGAASEVTLFWSDASHAQIRQASMVAIAHDAGPYQHNTRWRAVIPEADVIANQRLLYWIRARDAVGTVLWDSRGGHNHELVPAETIALPFGGPLWRFAGAGSFAIDADVATAQPAHGLGLGWWEIPTPPNFELEIDWRLDVTDNNSGVFVRFPDPRAFGYANEAWVAAHHGYEIQIDELARPDGAPAHRTGAIYEAPNQQLAQLPAAPPGTWNRFTIRAVGSTYTVLLDGTQVAHWLDPGDPSNPTRGQPATPTTPRFAGIQTHTGHVSFRNARLRRL